MAIDVWIIQCYETSVLFVNYGIFPSSCYLCTNIYYATILGCWPCVRSAPGPDIWL